MATKKKMLEAAAGTAAAGGASLDITEVFSTYLYTGNTSTQTITNGIDLDGEGGMTWIKSRTSANTAYIYDTERGATTSVTPSDTYAQESSGTTLTAFNSNGFSLGSANKVNGSSNNYASWTFRKAPKFFDCVTYTGTGVAKAIAHNLGSVPGMIIVKNTSNTANWRVYHRSTGELGGMVLNDTSAFADFAGYWNDVSPTDTEFTVGWNNEVNADTQTYVAYLFAHNDSGDGEFGPDGDQDIIKCGSYTGNGSTAGPEIDLGFEPQWMLTKRADSGSFWNLVDVSRGWTADGNWKVLYANLSDAEADGSSNTYALNSTGFKVTSTSSSYNASGGTYIYMAIRRGPLAPPEAGTEVFAPALTNSGSLPNFNSGFVTDFGMQKTQTSGAWYNYSRLTGTGYMGSDRADAENSSSGTTWDFMDGFGSGSSNSYLGWMWKRAPSYFDAVAYTGTGSARTVSHNLGVAPEMIWAKRRDAAVSWPVFHKQTGSSKRLFLNSANAEDSNTTTWNAVDPTATDFTVGNYTGANASGGNYIAYLFASLDGVSKVSSYTGNGSSQTINAGFTAGARFILIKRTDSTGDWYVWDTVRGIVAGNDPHLSLNTTAAEVSDDSIDPDSSGFIVNQISATNINVSSATYIYYAVA